MNILAILGIRIKKDKRIKEDKKDKRTKEDK